MQFLAGLGLFAIFLWILVDAVGFWWLVGGVALFMLAGMAESKK